MTLMNKKFQKFIKYLLLLDKYTYFLNEFRSLVLRKTLKLSFAKIIENFRVRITL